MLSHLLEFCCSDSGACGRRCCGRSLSQHGPVEHVVIVVVQRAEEYSEQLPQVHIVWSFVEAEAAAVVEIHSKLGRVALAEDVDWGRHLFLADAVIFLFLRGRFEALPWQ